MRDIFANKINANTGIAIILMILYIVSGVNMPDEVNNLVNSNMGAGVLIIGAIGVFSKVDEPCCAVLGFLVVYEVMRRAKKHYRDNRVVGASASGVVNRKKHRGVSYAGFGFSLEEGFVNSEEKKQAATKKPISMGAVEPLSSNDKGNYAKF
tara:strand:- start:2384 stop:2839 length:456 start_codon:yes stop_codon:yes gene_type:complete